VVSIYNVLNKRRGNIISDEIKVGTPLHMIQAHLPVAESFGFTADLEAATGGKAFPTCMFSHWDTMEGDYDDSSGRIAKVTMDIKKRKGLKEVMPVYTDYYDKL
jgi:elongation factor 2